MAKAKMNAIIGSLRGSLGKNLYVRTTKNGRMIISKKPDFGNRQFSEEQLNHQNRMALAAAYAKAASKDNPIYAKKAAGTSKNAYNLALKDWFKAPVIDHIKLHEGRIRVSAIDDVLVTRLTFTVLDEQGQCLEQGEADLVTRIWWEFQTASKGRIQVEAWDLAGNVTRREFEDPFPKKAA